jgi:hypothetical protein
MPQIPLGSGDESFELTFVISGAFDESPRVSANDRKVVGRKPERHRHAPAGRRFATESSEAEATSPEGVAPVWRANVLYRTLLLPPASYGEQRHWS